jgi:NTE family protein
VGVLRALARHGVPIHAIVGASAGAVVGASYAAVGMDPEELIADAKAFRGRHLLVYSLHVQLGNRFDRAFESRCGVIPHRLRQLEAATFERLHHGVLRLGVVCHDIAADRPRYFGTGLADSIGLAEAVRASASIPRLFPPLSITWRNEQLLLTDGGLSDPVPVQFARSLGATHVIVSDCRLIGRVPPTDPTTVWIRPRLASTGTLWSPRRGLLATAWQGEAGVTQENLDRIRGWLVSAPVDLATAI